MPVEQKSDVCLACQGVGLREVALIDGKYRIHECSQCRLLFVNPMPTHAFLQEFYNQQYPHDYLPTALHGIRKRRFELLVRRIRQALIRKGVTDIRQAKLFEVGVGGGDFLRQVAEAGIQVAGSDLSENAPLRKSHFPIRVGKFEEFGYKNEFDIIFSSHVIEHSNDPRGFVAAIALALKPGGRALVLTPNRDSLSMKVVECLKPKNKWVTLVSHPPIHLVGYNQKALGLLFESCGLSVEELTTLPCNESFFHPYAEVLVNTLLPQGKFASSINTALRRICVPFDLIWMMLTGAVFARFFLGEELLIVVKKAARP